MPADNERFTSGEIASLSWHNGGSNSAENVVQTRTAVARRTCSESRRYVKPPRRCMPSKRQVVNSDVRKLICNFVINNTKFNIPEPNSIVMILQQDMPFFRFAKIFHFVEFTFSNM